MARYINEKQFDAEDRYGTIEREAAVMCFDGRSGGGAGDARVFGSTTDQRMEQHLSQ